MVIIHPQHPTGAERREEEQESKDALNHGTEATCHMGSQAERGGATCAHGQGWTRRGQDSKTAHLAKAPMYLHPAGAREVLSTSKGPDTSRR